MLAWMIRFLINYFFITIGHSRSTSPPTSKLGESNIYSSVIEKPPIEELEFAVVNGNAAESVPVP